MNDLNPCLQKAMFVASEGYSVGTYETNLHQLAAKICDEFFILSSDTTPEALAA